MSLVNERERLWHPKDDKCETQDMFRNLCAEIAGSLSVEDDEAFPVVSPGISTTNAQKAYLIFELLKADDCECVTKAAFLKSLENVGILPTDPRLKQVFENLDTLENPYIDKETFLRVVSPCAQLLKKAYYKELILPEFRAFTIDLEELYNRCKEIDDGHVATYIPELALMNPGYWGIGVCTVDGQRFSMGDCAIPFSLQSCSKPLVYGIAMQQLGSEMVHQYVGHEPSGRNFNDVCLDSDNKPHNPMINTGAIMVCSLFQTIIGSGLSTEKQLGVIIDIIRKMAGGDYIGYNNTVYMSEMKTADRNYSLGYYMKDHACFPDNIDLQECMSLYFRTCCIEANCESLSVIAATLANGGICPITDQRILDAHVVRDVLSIMHTCGMYNYSGRFAFEVGLPAKSSVSGAIMLVVPNVMGVAMFAPPIDQFGNSIKCRRFCEELLKEYTFHPFEQIGHAVVNKKHALKSQGGGFDQLSVIKLLYYASVGDLLALKRYYLMGFDMTKTDYDGRTALHLAAAEGHLDCVKFLLDVCKVPHNPTDRWGHVPKGEASAFHRSEVFTFMRNWEQEKGFARSAEKVKES